MSDIRAAVLAGPGAPPTIEMLDLPRLGTVSATLALDADGLRIRLATENSASAALLLEERASLQNALAAAGVPALGIAVAAHA